MREDPVISAGALKVLGVLLVAALLGLGAYALAGDGINVDLPDLPDLETAGDVTTLENTTLSDTTVGSESGGQPDADPFTSAGLAQALAVVRSSAGASAQLTRVTVNETQTQFIVRRGDGVEAYSVRSDSGELVREGATITISGTATLDDFAFPIAAVKPAAIDSMLSAASKKSGASDFRPTVLSLERSIPFGSRELQWTINAQAAGRYVLYRAQPDGGDVRNEGGKGLAVPPAAQEAQRLNDCISAADGDAEEIFRCLDEF